MSHRLAAYAHLAQTTLKTGWYAALYRFTYHEIGRLSKTRAAPVRVTKPMPKAGELLEDVMRLNAMEAKAVRDGLYPAPIDEGASILSHLRAVRDMLADLPKANERRMKREANEAALLPQAEGLPSYYAQNFHYQSGGYLTEESASLYDVQVETLFLGAAGTMRRQAIAPIARYLRGKDQRQARLLDVACGTGQFLSQLAQTFPALPMEGIDLSAAYVEKAKAHLGDRRSIRISKANAEALPFPASSFDIVTCIFLFHELPREVRANVTAEMARALKPGGLLVFIDSLQWGDEPRYDGLLEAFPQRFHEPYYLDYLEHDLVGARGLFAASGLTVEESFRAFLAKVVVCRKPLK